MHLEREGPYVSRQPTEGNEGRPRGLERWLSERGTAWGRRSQGLKYDQCGTGRLREGWSRGRVG